MNSAGNTEGMNETVRERGILRNLNVTLATQESLFGNRLIEPRVAGRSLGAQEALRAGRVMNHVASD